MKTLKITISTSPWLGDVSRAQSRGSFMLPLPKPGIDRVSSEATKAKLRAALKGRKKSAEHIKASSCHRRKLIQIRSGIKAPTRNTPLAYMGE